MNIELGDVNNKMKIDIMKTCWVMMKKHEWQIYHIAYNKIEIHKVPSTLMKMTQRSEHITCICKHEDENKNEEDLLSDRTWWYNESVLDKVEKDEIKKRED